jgi:hypothetical protein
MSLVAGLPTTDEKRPTIKGYAIRESRIAINAATMNDGDKRSFRVMNPRSVVPNRPQPVPAQPM